MLTFGWLLGTEGKLIACMTEFVELTAMTPIDWTAERLEVTVFGWLLDAEGKLIACVAVFVEFRTIGWVVELEIE